MRKLIAVLFLYVLFCDFASAVPFAKWTKSVLTLNNGIVQRTIQLPVISGNFLTTAYKPVEGEFKYFGSANTDFQFEIDSTTYSGRSNWSLTGIKSITDLHDGDGAAVTLMSDDKKIEVTLSFLLYPDLPVVRKSLTIKNNEQKEVAIESVDTEKFSVTGYFATT